MSQIALDNPTYVDWQAPPRYPGEGEIHVWKWIVDATSVEPTALGRLDAVERERHARLVTPNLKQRYASAHAGLRRLLAGYLGCKPVDVEYRGSSTGKPLLRHGELQFNLSHTADCVAAIVGVSPVGIDIEQQRAVNNLRSLATKHFSPAEMASLDAPSSLELGRRFFEVWSRKEAVLKCLGVGFRHPNVDLHVGVGVPRSVEVAIPVGWNSEISRCWVASCWSSDVAEAVASAAPFQSIRVFTFAATS